MTPVFVAVLPAEMITVDSNDPNQPRLPTPPRNWVSKNTDYIGFAPRRSSQSGRSIVEIRGREEGIGAKIDLSSMGDDGQKCPIF